MNKFLYIYTFYSTDQCRMRNFIASIEQLKSVEPEADICVVEQNGLTKIPDVTFHHRVDIDDTNFHKTGLLNFAVANHPDYTHYVMIDADSWIDAGVVDNIHNHCDDAPLVFPYETCVYLTEAQTRRKCRHDAVDIPLRYNSNIPITRQTGLINCFSKETYQQVGGSGSPSLQANLPGWPWSRWAGRKPPPLQCSSASAIGGCFRMTAAVSPV